MKSESWMSYESAASVARIEVRELDALDELHEASDLLGEIWGVPDNPPMSGELLRALGKADNYVTGAYDDEKLVGVCVGFHAQPSARTLHSHIAGITSSVAGRHVGFALKLHQRAWSLDRGIELIEWTYDPLVARNAYFNLAKLGARPAEYLPNFYGAMGDGINGDDDSDRLMVHWQLNDPTVVGACAGSPLRPEPPADAVTSWIEVPEDIEGLRLSDPTQARKWRAQVRDQLMPAVAAGWPVLGFDRHRGYQILLPTEGVTNEA